MKNLNDNEVETVFDLYRRGNNLRKGDFPNKKNGFVPFIREGNPGNLVDEGSLEYMRSQYLNRLYDLPVDSKQIGEFKERINKLRTEFYNRSILPERLKESVFGYFEKVIVQGEIADIFNEELQKNNYDGDIAEQKTRDFYERAWPALERGYSIEDLRKGKYSGEHDLNGPEGKVFDLNREIEQKPFQKSPVPREQMVPAPFMVPVPSRKPMQPMSRRTPSGSKSPNVGMASSEKTLRRSNQNPFFLEKSDLREQDQLLESNPLLARQMIVAAGRDPRLFGL